ncbi:MAG: hypothetical protein ACKOXI_03820, partial [Candidatus Planktophila sp.]
LLTYEFGSFDRAVNKATFSLGFCASDALCQYFSNNKGLSPFKAPTLTKSISISDGKQGFTIGLSPICSLKTFHRLPFYAEITRKGHNDEPPPKR